LSIDNYLKLAIQIYIWQTFQSSDLYWIPYIFLGIKTCENMFLFSLNNCITIANISLFYSRCFTSTWFFFKAFKHTKWSHPAFSWHCS